MTTKHIEKTTPTPLYELAVREQICPWNGKSLFVVQELESGEELFEGEHRSYAECWMFGKIAKQPEKYFTSQDTVRKFSYPSHDDAQCFAYRISPTGAGSAKFGVCEICGKHADSVYIFTRYLRHFSLITNTDILCHKGNAFGHKECLATLTLHSNA